MFPVCCLLMYRPVALRLRRKIHSDSCKAIKCSLSIIKMCRNVAHVVFISDVIAGVFHQRHCKIPEFDSLQLGYKALPPPRHTYLSLVHWEVSFTLRAKLSLEVWTWKEYENMNLKNLWRSCSEERRSKLPPRGLSTVTPTRMKWLLTRRSNSLWDASEVIIITREQTVMLSVCPAQLLWETPTITV